MCNVIISPQIKSFFVGKLNLLFKKKKKKTHKNDSWYSKTRIELIIGQGIFIRLKS